MVYVIGSNHGIDWKVKGNDRILQNITNLINTFKYEVAYDRTLGMDKSILDRPVTELQAIIPAMLTELIAEKEPRASIKEVKLLGVSTLGDIDLEVVIEI